jgi:hypothetical protein
MQSLLKKREMGLRTNVITYKQHILCTWVLHVYELIKFIRNFLKNHTC